MIKRHIFLILLVLMFYPLFVTTIIPDVLRTPFDTETIGRFIIPFQFQGNDNIPWAVTESVQWDIFRPIYCLSILSDYVLWDTDARMYHVTDLLLSWVCYCLAFFLLKRQFGFLTAAIAVCLWTVHPSQCMSLLKIYGRNDRLVTLFTIAALFTYDMSFIKNEHRKLLFTLTLLFVILSTLSKDTGIFYCLLLPAWSILVKKRSIKETVKSDRMLWSGLLFLIVMFVVLRSIADFSIAIDSDGLNLGLNYFRLQSILIQMGFPLPPVWNLNPFAVCAITALAVITAVFSRKCPGAIRFGAFSFSIFIFPFPFFWIQDSFLWGFWLWISLAMAGSAVYLFDKYVKNRNIVFKLLTFSVLIIVLSISAVWSIRVTRRISAPMIEMHEIAMYAVSSEEGPVYSEENIFSRFPGWAHRMNHGPVEERMKFSLYIVHMIRVETGIFASTMNSPFIRENW
ncbi:MAG: hypothetical protein K8S15_07235 [Candidatus Aegiribacteria sp.]|nr:hypothetical protein [Candidatus Aegiribacteria sp.]